MKLRNILIAFSAVALMSGCSQDPMEGVEKGANECEITLSIKINTGMNLLTRSTRAFENEENVAPRDIVNWQGEQAVNDMRVYVFSAQTADGPYLYYGGGDCADGAYSVPFFNNVFPWNGGTVHYDENFQKCNYSFRPRLGSGRYYKFLAIGRDDKTGEDRPTRPIDYVPWGTKVFGDANVKVGVTDINDVTLTNLLNFTHYPFVTTEIFSGICDHPVYVDPNARGFAATIELRRAVAGFWFYVTDIPTAAVDNSGRENYDGLYFYPNELTVYITCASNTLNVSSRTDGGSSPENYERTVQIGYIDFTNRYGQRENSYWSKSLNNPYWQRAKIDSYRGMTIAANSAMMSGFLIPVDETHLLPSDVATLTLQLRERETDYTFRRQLHCRIKEVLNPATGTTTDYHGESYKFPIVANYLYALGSEHVPYSLARIGNPAPAKGSAEISCIASEM